MSATRSDENPQRAVREVQQQFWTALKDKDRPGLERLVADDFVLRSPGHANQGRAAFIDTLTGSPDHVRSVGSDNLEVHVWGDIAVVSGVQSAQLESAKGQLRANTIAITNVFQWQEGQWVLKLAHAIALD